MYMLFVIVDFHKPTEEARHEKELFLDHKRLVILIGAGIMTNVVSRREIAESHSVF